MPPHLHSLSDLGPTLGPTLGALLGDGALAGLCGPGTLAGVALAAFVMALVGGFSHCATMCGPFVLMQVADDAGAVSGPTVRRLRGALLPGYQAGRFTTYMLLGALAGGLGGGAMAATGLRPVAALFLGMAAAAMAAQALKGWWPGRWAGGWPGVRAPAGLVRVLSRVAGGGAGGLGHARGYRLGLALGFLPCGFLYAALAAAAATGGAWSGALVMGAFVAGTLPALTLVAVAGFGLASRWRAWAGRLAPPVYLVNAVTLGILAVRILR